MHSTLLLLCAARSALNSFMLLGTLLILFSVNIPMRLHRHFKVSSDGAVSVRLEFFMSQFCRAVECAAKIFPPRSYGRA